MLEGLVTSNIRTRLHLWPLWLQLHIYPFSLVSRKWSLRCLVTSVCESGVLQLPQLVWLLPIFILVLFQTGGDGRLSCEEIDDVRPNSVCDA